MTKTPEEKAREYAKQEAFNNSYDDESYRQMYDIAERSFLDGYHSSDEEVKELRGALKECIDNIKCIEANVNHSEGFFNALMNTTVFCEQAKQLLKE